MYQPRDYFRLEAKPKFGPTLRCIYCGAFWYKNVQFDVLWSTEARTCCDNKNCRQHNVKIIAPSITAGIKKWIDEANENWV